jgi:hypothetical protein
MLYIVRVPGVPRPYVSTDPRIYIDALKLFNWECESRPFDDTYCKALREEEEFRHLGDKRRDQLEAYWIEELERRKQPAKTSVTEAEEAKK